MGVSGCGKTTIGQLLSEQTGYPFYDADQFHPETNIQKMASGMPLADEDRWPWLNAIRDFAAIQSRSGPLIIACSALKQSYRDLLSDMPGLQIDWILLEGSYDILFNRLEQRAGHFMPATLLQSQLDILEIPSHSIRLNIAFQPLTIVLKIIESLSISLRMQAFGLIGLGVMGKSLSRNLANKGILLSLYNRRVVGKEEDIAVQFIQDHPELIHAKGFEDLPAFVASLSLPRKIMLMVNAGESTDDIIQQLMPLLQTGDIVIDGGNAHYLDTEKRIKQLAMHGIQYLGVGVSGGEAGALLGPSIMPGGNKDAYISVQPILEQIAAINSKGFTCCKYIGAGGAGHFVKMVHNGIEYAEMQLLAELVQYLKVVGGHEYDLIALLLKPYLQGPLSSYLLEITVQILQTKSNGNWLLNQIMDNAGNKGTGSWTSMEAAKIGLPIPTLTAALNARFMSAMWRTRQQLANKMPNEMQRQPINIQQLMEAYQLCRIINHHQGFHLIETVSNQNGWGIDLAELAGVWTAGCIIRSQLMEQLQELFSVSTQLLLHPEIVNYCNQSKSSLKHLLSVAVDNELPMEAFSASAQYLFAMKQSHSGASLIQAQRDFFGAHTYQLKDNPEGPFYHFNWQEI